MNIRISSPSTTKTTKERKAKNERKKALQTKKRKNFSFKQKKMELWNKKFFFFISFVQQINLSGQLITFVPSGKIKKKVSKLLNLVNKINIAI